jgi:2-methylisoborneol synthase
MRYDRYGQDLARVLAGPSGRWTAACRLQGTSTLAPAGPAPAEPAVPAPVPAAPGPAHAASEPAPAGSAGTGAARPGPTHPGPAQPGTGQPGTGQPGTGQPGTAQPGEALAALCRPELVPRDACAPLPYVEREWGDGSYPPLYCPQTVRIDDALAEEVNRRLVAWAQKVGLHEGRMDNFRETGFGRLAMLTHPDTDDPDLLLVAAQMNAAWWAADDYYADETALGATPTELPPRLALVMSAMDPPPPAGDYTRQLGEAIEADPVLVALSSATAHLTRHATPAQVMRARSTTFQMYVSWTAYAAWRFLGRPPPVWRYLAARQHDSFYTSMTLIDVVGGYELPANLFGERRFHRALMQAGTASVIVNDLHSVAREAADELPDSNLILLIAAEENCTIREATNAAVALHNDFVRGFEASQRRLAAAASVELQRFLRGAQAWMGGGFEWHSTTRRYQ